jgi:tetratricopeptide (TPR) repeat protein
VKRLQKKNSIKVYKEEQAKQLIKDTTYFNFSFAQAVKVSYFTSRDDDQSALFAVAKYYDDKDFVKPGLEAHRKAFDFNRSGSNTIGVKRVLSLYNFTEALKLYFDHSMDSLLLSFGNMNLKSLLTSLKSDTLTKNDYYAVGKSMSNIAMLYQISGLYAISKELNLTLLDFVSDNIGNHSLLEASIYNNLGLIELSIGNYHIAEDFMNKASGILLERKNELKLDLAVLYNNQAMLYQQTGQYDKAILKVDDALTVAKDKINNKATDYSKLKLNKALILKAQKKYVEAESLLLELKKTKESRFGKAHQDYADIQSILASLYMEMDRNDLVEPLLLNALDIYKKKFSEELRHIQVHSRHLDNITLLIANMISPEKC